MSNDNKCPECGNSSIHLDTAVLSALDGCKTCELVLEKYNEFKAQIAGKDVLR